MMAGGRKSIPTRLKMLAGNPGKRPLNDAEPQPIADATSWYCPEWLPKAAKVEWRAVAPELHRLGLLTRIDRSALAAYCAAVARWHAAESDVAERGILVERSDGSGLDRNPALGVIRDAVDQLRKFASEFGLTPSSRSRLSGAKGPPADAFDEWIKTG